MALNLLHFGDVHFPGALRGWRATDLFSKKLVGLVNVKLLGRGYKFRHANAVVDAMLADIRRTPPDALLFSGDATMLALPREFVNAAERLGVKDSTLPPGFAVPGNHDYYTKHAERAGGFEQAFAPWQTGIRIDGHTYPFARRVGSVWLIGVNSSYQGFGIGASGTIGPAQFARLQTLCSGLSDGPRILVTHYPLRDSHGNIERASHRLRDHVATLAVAKDCGISLWVHGHIHKPFVLKPTAAIPFPVICSGSATQEHRYCFNRYHIDGRTLTMTRRVYDPTTVAFQDGEVLEMELN
jgi:3',5'-cyclic AMP phosphodiesterase CpdA